MVLKKVPETDNNTINNQPTKHAVMLEWHQKVQPVMNQLPLKLKLLSEDTWMVLYYTS